VNDTVRGGLIRGGGRGSGCRWGRLRHSRHGGRRRHCDRTGCGTAESGRRSNQGCTTKQRLVLLVSDLIGFSILRSCCHPIPESHLYPYWVLRQEPALWGGEQFLSYFYRTPLGYIVASCTENLGSQAIPAVFGGRLSPHLCTGRCVTREPKPTAIHLLRRGSQWSADA